MKRVYLTALTNERYIPGVMALARSLFECKAAYKLAVMIPDDQEVTLGSKIREYGILDIPGTFLLPKQNVSVQGMDDVVEDKYSYWRASFFKLQAAACTEFEKIILLDCDQMVVKNIDHLFDKPAFSATTCGRCVHEDWQSLSAGLLVLEPSEALYKKLIDLIVPSIEFKKAKGLQAGDQDVFNRACPEWRNCLELFIPEKYNICWGWISDLCRKEGITPRDFYMIHFPGKEKPWDYGKHYYLCIRRSPTAAGAVVNGRSAVLQRPGKTCSILF